MECRTNRYNLSPYLVKNGIYLDFEGEGKKRDGSIPSPHMAGIYKPYLDGYNYHVLFFKSSWKPVKAMHMVKQDRIGGFKDLMDGLITEAENENRLIFYWTIHEKMMIERHAPELVERFEQVGFNLHKPAKKFANRRGLLKDETEKKGLNQFLKMLKPASALIVACKPTAAEACRRIDNYATKTKRWCNWNIEQKKIAKDLLRYNKDDCLAVLRLARKIGNSTN